MTNISDKQKPAALLVEQLSRQFAPHERTVPAMLTRQAERFSDKPLVTCGDAVWSYAQTRDEAARWHLVELPAAPGAWARIRVRQWSTAAHAFREVACYELRIRP